MPIFKKASSDSGGVVRLSEVNRRALRRSRMPIIKDVDVLDIMDTMVQEDGFKPETRDNILSYPTREQKIGVFLDQLELRGDKAFMLFKDSLREKYKHLVYIIDDNINNINEDDQSQQKEKPSISGDAVRKLLANRQRRKLEYSHGSESVDDLDIVFEDKLEENYIDAYSIPMRGKLQKDKWIKYDCTPKQQESSFEKTYMGITKRDLLFKKISFDEIPLGVKKPLIKCDCYILDRENKYGLKRTNNFCPRSVQQDRRRGSERTLLNLPPAPEPPVPKSPGHRNAKDPLPLQPDQVPAEVPPPPPVPPKPGHLPPLNMTTLSTNEEKKERIEPALPPRSSSTKPAVMTKPKADITKVPESSSNVEDASLKQSVPPEEKESPLEYSQPEVKNDKKEEAAMPQKIPNGDACPPAPPAPPKRQVPTSSSSTARPNSGSASSPEPAAPPVPPRVNAPLSPETSLNKPLPPQKQESKDSVETDDQNNESFEECDESLMSLQIPAPDDTEEENSTAAVIGANNDTQPPDGEEDYEAIGQPEPSVPTVNSSTNVKAGTSRECTPDEEDTSRQDGFSKASADSLDSSFTPASIALSSTGDSGVDALQSNSTITTNCVKEEKTIPANMMAPVLPKQWSDIQVLANNESSDNDSYYEDIDALDGDRSCKSSIAYLDPKSQRSFDRGRFGSSYGPKSNSIRRIMDDIETQGCAFLKNGEYVVIEKDIACEVPEPMQEELEELSSSHSNDSKQESCESLAGEDECSVSRTPSVKKTVAALEAAAKAARQNFENVKDEIDPGSIKKEVHMQGQSKLDLHLDFRSTSLAYDKNGRVFYIPTRYVKKQGDPEDEVWFYPFPISSNQAALFLSVDKQEGCFLVYKPSTPSEAVYNLSLCRRNGDILHYHIIENVHGDVMIEGHDHSFLNVIELVSYFKQNKSQLATRLRRPLKEVKMPITPGYHYELKYEINRSHLSLSSDIIGKGNFGVVCSGRYQNISVAVKVLQQSDISQQEEDDFVEEAKTIMGLRHDHIVRLIGLSCTAKPFFLVTEFVQKGNLKNCLRNRTIATDSIDILFDICIQMTTALAFLESKNYILHRDIAARNFLVADDLCVKLADFGRARYVVDDNYQAPKNETIPIKWASPEVLVHSRYSLKSDIWALGITYWEIFSYGEQPYGCLSSEQVAVYVAEGERLEKPPGCPPDLFNIMKSCWRENQDDRPYASQLCDKLKSKSSIYYTPAPTKVAENLNTKKKFQSAASKDSTFIREKTPTTPVLSKKHRQKVAVANEIRMRRSLTGGDIKQESHFHEDSGLRENKSRERLPTSSSETSLTSMALERDDLTRGDKIRKSLRKMMSMKPKRKPSNVKDMQSYKDTQGMRHSVPISMLEDYDDNY